MLNAFSVRWFVSDDTKIKYSDEFESSDYVLKIDILEDAIYMLQQKHDEIMGLQDSSWIIKDKDIQNATI